MVMRGISLCVLKLRKSVALIDTYIRTEMHFIFVLSGNDDLQSTRDKTVSVHLYDGIGTFQCRTDKMQPKQTSQMLQAGKKKNL